MSPEDIAHIEGCLRRAQETRRGLFGPVKTTKAEVAEIVLVSYVPRMLREIKRLRPLPDDLRAILADCENDFHRCERCDYQDDNATKESNLYLLLKSLLDHQSGAASSEAVSDSGLSTKAAEARS